MIQKDYADKSYHAKYWNVIDEVFQMRYAFSFLIRTVGCFSSIFHQKWKVIDFDHFMNNDLIIQSYNMGHYITCLYVMCHMNQMILYNYDDYRIYSCVKIQKNYLVYILYDMKIIGQFRNDRSPCIFSLYS